MAKIELYQAVLNKMLSDIRDDAMDAFAKPPIEGNIDDVSDEDLEKQALDLHQKGQTGDYLYCLAQLELRNMQRKLK
jgi:hypothetical protein